MVCDEDIRTIPLKTFESRDLHVDTSRDENKARPRARAPVREAAAALEQTRRDRECAQSDRVERDGGDQKEDSPPPVVGGHSIIKNSKFKRRDSKCKH